MTALNRSTRRRLQQLRQVPSVWEGDRRVLTPEFVRAAEGEGSQKGDCILWVDGTEGMVRAMDIVSAEAGPEAIVRVLLQAMEHPHSSVMPCRPQKILVRDRELQFFLRGVLQDLHIVVDYIPELPLIDEIFQGMQNMASGALPDLPVPYAEPILQTTRRIWEIAPWTTLDEEKIVAVEINDGEPETLYVSILGMLGMEFGLLMYRSLESLKKFRRQVMDADDNSNSLEEAFLEQDCLFVTFDRDEEDEDPELDSAPNLEYQPLLAEFQAETGVQPCFGNLHPLEGMRPILYEEEARMVFLALTALQKFFEQHLTKFDVETFPAVNSRYRITTPEQPGQKISVKVSTLPDVAEELYEMAMEAEFEGDDITLPVLRHDLIPEDAFYSVGAMPWNTYDVLRNVVPHHQTASDDLSKTSDGYPVILIQTSRPKAKVLIEELQAAGGLKGICFNPGEDPISGEQYDLGILQMNNGELHLFGEFYEQDPVHIQARKKWDQRCKKTKGYCGLVIARGLKGNSRGNPQLSDMMALFETRALSDKDLGLGPLQLMPQIEGFEAEF
jgi:hypothetical protein